MRAFIFSLWSINLFLFIIFIYGISRHETEKNYEKIKERIYKIEEEIEKIDSMTKETSIKYLKWYYSSPR